MLNDRLLLLVNLILGIGLTCAICVLAAITRSFSKQVISLSTQLSAVQSYKEGGIGAAQVSLAASRLAGIATDAPQKEKPQKSKELKKPETVPVFRIKQGL